MVLECTVVNGSFLWYWNGLKIVFWDVYWFLQAAKGWSSSC